MVQGLIKPKDFFLGDAALGAGDAIMTKWYFARIFFYR